MRGEVLAEALAQKRLLIEAYSKESSVALRGATELLLCGQRIGREEGVVLYREATLPLLSLLATYVRLQKNGYETYYNRNAHVEPTNICLFQCSFCSYRRDADSPEAWNLTLEQIAQRVKEQEAQGNTEVHITGGVHPSWTIEDLEQIVHTVHTAAPTLHIKAFSAVELIAIFQKSDLTWHDGLSRLKNAGLCSIPGGGAEIFDESVRRRICPEKCTGREWLALHREAHKLGMTSNATMLFGHIESYEHRVDHMLALRNLQDETRGFNCFIPLKYRAAHNALAVQGEVSLLEVLRNYAVSRCLLDNIEHLKCYWPMLGKKNLPIALHYGVDDLDGTIGNSTRIYSMAGAQDNRPSATVEELQQMVYREGFVPFERNSVYEKIVTSA